MSFSLNKVQLIGRLGHDPSMRYTQQGEPVTTFDVATDRPARPGEPAETDWHRVGVSSDCPESTPCVRNGRSVA
jgi:single-strand DNA-binding protein